MDIFFGKRVGVWGYGVGGRSLVNFLLTRGIETIVFDEKSLKLADQQTLTNKNVRVCANRDSFFSATDIIVPSPGIDINPYLKSAAFIAELDVFAHFFKKPAIAVTGTVGKTTVTSALNAFIGRAGLSALVGGNIGVGMMDLVAPQDGADWAVLEVSSFQLEHACAFEPRIAVWTNLHANHLDRHHDLESYGAAKSRILLAQKLGDCAVVPPELVPLLRTSCDRGQHWLIINDGKPSATLMRQLMPNDEVIYVANDGVYVWRANVAQKLVKVSVLQQFDFVSNGLAIVAALYAAGVPLSVLEQPINLGLSHRIEFVRTLNGIDFYNDSKATVVHATLGAVQHFAPRPVILLVGGTSKGVDRRPFLAQLSGKVKAIVCFGAEAHQLHEWACECAIASCACADLGGAVEAACKQAVPGDVVLLSPAGASFDLFANYQARGLAFRELVMAL